MGEEAKPELMLPTSGQTARQTAPNGTVGMLSRTAHRHIYPPAAATTRSTPRQLVIYIRARKRFLQSLVLVLSTLIGPGSGLGSANLVNDRELQRGDPVFNSIDNPPPRKFH
jgi:hypothetical protein